MKIKYLPFRLKITAGAVIAAAATVNIVATATTLTQTGNVPNIFVLIKNVFSNKIE